MKHHILATDDSVNTCDCCGKTGLKMTFVCELEDGSIVHYGSTCVSKHTGVSAPKALKAICEEAKAKREALEKKLSQTHEAIMLEAKRLKAYKAGLVGKAFYDFCEAELEAYRAKREEIINS